MATEDINYVALPACTSASSNNCYWSASQMGTGEAGSSDYVKLNGVVRTNLISIPEWYAKGYQVENTIYIMPDGLPRPDNEQVLTAADAAKPLGLATLGVDGKVIPAQLPASISEGENVTSSLIKLRAGLRRRNLAPVLFFGLGGSTTEGMRASTRSKSYFSRLVSMLQSAYPIKDVTPSSTLTLNEVVTNPTSGVHGINGAIISAKSNDFLTDAMITQMVGMSSINGFSALHIMIGSQDWATGVTPAVFKVNLNNWLTKIKTAFTSAGKPFSVTLIGTFGRLDSAASVPPVAPWSSYLAAMRDLALADSANVAYLDVSKTFYSIGISNPTNFDPFRFVSVDKSNLVDEGHDFLAEVLRELYGIPSSPSTPLETVVLPEDGRFKLLTSDTFDSPEIDSMAFQVTDAELGGVSTRWESSAPTAWGRSEDGYLIPGPSNTDGATLGFDVHTTSQAIEIELSQMTSGNLYLDARAPSVSQGQVGLYRLELNRNANVIRLRYREAGGLLDEVSGVNTILCDLSLAHTIRFEAIGPETVKLEDGSSTSATTLRVYVDGTLSLSTTAKFNPTGNWIRLARGLGSDFRINRILVSGIGGYVSPPVIVPPVEPPAGQTFTLLTTDTFGGAATTSMIDENTDALFGGIPTTWETVNGTSMRRSGSGQLVPSDTRSSLEALGMNVSSIHQEVTMIVAKLTAGSCWLDLRAESMANSVISAYRIQLISANKTIQLLKRASGGSNVTIGAPYGVDWASGSHTIRFKVDSNTIQVWVDNVLAYDVTDSTISVGNYWRFATVSGSAYEIDSFRVLAVDGAVAPVVVVPPEEPKPLIYTSDDFKAGAVTTMMGQNSDGNLGGARNAWESNDPGSFARTADGFLIQSANPTTSVLAHQVGSPDQRVRWGMAALAGGTTWIDFRRLSADANVISSMRIAMSPSAGTIQLVQRATGTFNLGDPIPVDFTVGHTYEVSMIGTAIKVYVDNVLVQEATSATITTGNYVGIAMTSLSKFSLQWIMVYALNSTTKPYLNTTAPPTAAPLDAWKGVKYRADGDSSGIRAQSEYGDTVAGIDYTSAQRWPNLVATGWDAPPSNTGYVNGLETTVKNMHVGGSNCIDVAMRWLKVGGTHEFKWTDLYGLITALVSGNDAGRFHASSIGTLGYKNGIRAMLSIVRAGARVLPASTKATGTWVVAPSADQYSKSTMISTTKGSTMTLKWTGAQPATLFILSEIWSGGKGTSYTINFDGVIQTKNSKNQGLAGSKNARHAPQTTVLKPKTSGEHTVIITHNGAAGEPLIVDCLMPWKTSQAEMPFLLLCHPGKSTTIGYMAYGQPYPTDADIEAFRVIMDDVVAEFGNYSNVGIIQGDEIDKAFPPGDTSKRIRDGLHPNLAGMKAIANTVIQALRRYTPSS